MSVSTSKLDSAYEQLAASGFELPNGFVNHGPMAVEALAALGADDAIADWASRFSRIRGDDVDPVRPGASWSGSLGSYSELPSWIGYFSEVIDESGWREVVSTWVPRLMPALVTKLFHGAIRMAHAVRAVDAVDSAPRRAELARALGYWAATYRPGQSALPFAGPGDASLEAAVAAGHYLARPDIFNLHGVTGAMAVHLLCGHIPADAGDAALGQLRAEHQAMWGVSPSAGPAGPRDRAGASAPAAWADMVMAAAGGRDPHQVKMVEACQRGLAATGDGVFAAAAAVVVGL